MSWAFATHIISGESLVSAIEQKYFRVNSSLVSSSGPLDCRQGSSSWRLSSKTFYWSSENIISLLINGSIKKCCDCRIEEPLTNFYHKKSVKHGLHRECNTCRHEYYIENKEKLFPKMNCTVPAEQ